MKTEIDKQYQQKNGVLTLDISRMVFMLFCIYFSLGTLSYVDWFPLPASLTTYTLYSFVGLGAFLIAIEKQAILYTHTKWYTLFLMFCVLSAIYSINVSVSFAQLITIAKVYAFSIVTTHVVKTEKRKQIAFGVLIISNMLLIAYLQSSGQLDIGERLGNELMGNANIFALLYMLGACACIYYIFLGSNKLVKVIGFCSLIIHQYALALSGGRKYFVLPILLFVGMLAMKTDKWRRKHIARNMLLAAIVLVLCWWALMTNDFLYETIGYRFEGLVNLMTGAGEVDRSTLSRMGMINAGLELWNHRPVLGYGIDTYKVMSGFGVYAHNNYIELLADLGLVGTLVYYSYYVYIIPLLLARKTMDMEKWYWLGIMVALLIFDYAGISYNLFYVQLFLSLAGQYAAMSTT